MSENIVMIHGMWCRPWVWDNFRSTFEGRGFACHTPTLRYHDMAPDQSPDPRLGTTSLLDYANDLELLIRELNDRPIVMGHSMGGLLAQMLGARGLARALVLLTPASPAGINALAFSVVKSFWGVLTSWGWWRKPHRLSFNAAVYALLHLLGPGERKAAYDRLVYESGRAAFEIGYWYIDPRKATRIDAARVTCPVLVISGAEDRITPAAVGRKVARKYQAVSTYRVYENHAHWVMSETGWENIATDIADWLGQQS